MKRAEHWNLIKGTWEVATEGNMEKMQWNTLKKVALDLALQAFKVYDIELAAMTILDRMQTKGYRANSIFCDSHKFSRHLHYTFTKR